MADADVGREEKAATGRLLVGLTAVALLVAVLGFVVMWALTYGPLA
jgi:hypothetical protein